MRCASCVHWQVESSGQRRTFASRNKFRINLCIRSQKKLEKAGFIKIVRGAEGGCRLAVDLRTVSVYDLMEALDTDRLVNACMQPGYRCNWQEAHIEPCGFHRRFEEIQERMDALLRSYSIDWLLYGRCL